MSKQKFDTMSLSVPYAKIAWRAKWNYARESGDMGSINALVVSMTNHGWHQTAAGTVTVTVLNDEDKKLVLAERENEWSLLKIQAEANPSEGLVELQAFEQLFVEKGKLITPEFRGITGHRRAHSLRKAAPKRLLFKNADGVAEPKDLNILVPAIPMNFTTEMDLLKYQLAENESEREGFYAPNIFDKLKSARRLFAMGAIQVDFRRVFKDGVGQKLHGILTLDKLWPNIQIVDRMLKDPKDPQHINPGPVSHTDLPSLIKRSNPKEVASANQKKREELTRLGKPEAAIELEMLAPATEGEVRAYFEGKREGANAQKIMSKENIKGLADQGSCRAVVAAANAVYSNNRDVLEWYLTEGAQVMNLAETLGKADLEAAEKILAACLDRSVREKVLQVIG